MLIICPAHTLTASACVIAYELNFQQQGKRGREGMGSREGERGERTGDISAA